jgi:hypothetical protein
MRAIQSLLASGDAAVIDNALSALVNVSFDRLLCVVSSLNPSDDGKGAIVQSDGLVLRLCQLLRHSLIVLQDRALSLVIKLSSDLGRSSHEPLCGRKKSARGVVLRRHGQCRGGHPLVVKWRRAN